MGQLSISNIVNISVATVQTGVNAYNTSNLGLFTDEAPNLSTFGTLGYAIYLSPQQVGIDFGTDSKTYAMANAVFSQQPNILNGGGALIVILMINSIQHVAFSGLPASGAFEFEYQGSYYSAAINWDDTADQIQTKLRAVTGLEKVLVTGSMATSLNIQFAGVYGDADLLTTVANTLAATGPVSITITVTSTTTGETIDEAITRTEELVQYFGIIVDESLDVIGEDDLLDAAAVVQALNKIAIFVSHTQADIEPGGMIDELATGGFTQTRGLYYGNVDDDSADIIMMASYAGLGFSTNFSGSNTTSTMNLKTLVGVQPDLSMTQTVLNLAEAAGADTYPSLQGVPAIISTGENSYFDEIYGIRWFAGALQVAGFNFLATSSTKIPQTESGMDGLKGAYRNVCNQAVTNQLVAPGSWNSPDIFGDPGKFILNIGQFGYYIFSQSIAQQSQADRVARKAPLVQIAIKLAGAIQESTVIVFVNP